MTTPHHSREVQRSHPEPWEWGAAYIRNAVGRLERLLAEATVP
jgi:hypothetical protein